MTGAYLRVNRDGKWQNIEVEHLTSTERKDVFGGRSPEELVRWIDMLCTTIVDIQHVIDNAGWEE